MAIKAIFVGINKHLDASIPELGGARRDATALWALLGQVLAHRVPDHRLVGRDDSAHVQCSGRILINNGAECAPAAGNRASAAGLRNQRKHIGVGEAAVQFEPVAGQAFP